MAMQLESHISLILCYWDRTCLMSIRAEQNILGLNQFLEELLLLTRIENSMSQRRSNCLLSTRIGSLRPLLKESRMTFGSRCCQRGQRPALNTSLLMVCHILILEKLPFACSAWLLQVLLWKKVFSSGICPFETLQPTCIRQSPEIGFYSSGWH